MQRNIKRQRWYLARVMAFFIHVCEEVWDSILRKENSGLGESLLIRYGRVTRALLPTCAMRQDYPETRTRQRHHGKIELQMNVADEYRPQHPQKNTNKMIPATY